VLDPKRVNRLLLDNCGIGDDEMSTILHACAQQRDFKSLVYKHNTFGDKTLNELPALLQSLDRKLPHHFEELAIIDCKITKSISTRLVDMITQGCYLFKLQLVNCNLTETSVESLTQYLMEPQVYIEHLDLSWCKTPRTTWTNFFEGIKCSKKLRSLTLAGNLLVE
jgi:Ran GTPase-activating protein (RanGAP) involved in mRNA processing and transport